MRTSPTLPATGPAAVMTAPDADSHLALGLAESAACGPTDWERWADRVEAIMGRDIDGDQATDGFSIDAFLMLFEAGETPQAAIAKVAEVVF